MIGRCLQSVAWADETIVMDSEGTDGTQDICRALGAKVFYDRGLARAPAEPGH